MFCLSQKKLKYFFFLIIDSHSYFIRLISFSPDGNTLAVGCFDKSIHILYVKIGQYKAKLDDLSSSVKSVCFSPDGITLASGSYDKSIHLWDVKNKYCSDYRFKEIKVKSTRYPFYPFAIHLIQWFTQTSILYRFERVFYKKPFPFRRIIGVYSETTQFYLFIKQRMINKFSFIDCEQRKKSQLKIIISYHNT